jgi:endonuclease/exonuclease/phosphatase family metal-dependent hydrolase
MTASFYLKIFLTFAFSLAETIMRIPPVIIILFFLLAIPASCRKTPEPPSPHISVNFGPCITTGSPSSFEIVTFNLEGFPKAGSITILAVRDIILTLNPDVIALQEMTNESDFNNLLDELPGWDGRFYPLNNDEWNLAYLFKTSEVTIDDSKTRTILGPDDYAFPRPPFEIFVRHKTLNISAYLINLHLKCCGGSDNEDRRRDAAVKLENYVAASRPNDPVIILGDFNDEISGNSSINNVFYNFVSSTLDYLFTDMDIAKGSLLWWSYPTYPSHIDHILVTNELFSNVDTVMVIKTEPCYPDYFDNISDHRPVELILK